MVSSVLSCGNTTLGYGSSVASGLVKGAKTLDKHFGLSKKVTGVAVGQIASSINPDPFTVGIARNATLGNCTTTGMIQTGVVSVVKSLGGEALNQTVSKGVGALADSYIPGSGSFAEFLAKVSGETVMAVAAGKVASTVYNQVPNLAYSSMSYLVNRGS
ncbi:MAG: hypothetical protein VX777_09010 [Chlamydiota bacterium]|nr:hypothetical protein [Chlamydiota bacterium]